MSRLVAAVVAFVVLTAVHVAVAHPLHFGSLVVRAEGSARYHVSFRFSGTEDQPAEAHVRWPRDCRDDGSPQETHDVLGIHRIGHIRCDRPIEGREVVVEGLDHGDLQVLAEYRDGDGEPRRDVLDGAHPAFRVAAPPTRSARARRFFALGAMHIARGIDHLAFVLALVVLSRTARRLVATVTAFTIGHSITLALATLGFLRIAAAPVEACIALSLVLVAYEAAHPEHTTFTRRAPWLVAALFGLVHGLGFASALRDVGLGRRELPLALATFNLGVEAGQLAFVLVAWPILTRTGGESKTRRERGVAYVVGTLGTYLLLDRLHTILR